ncbi:hypothetical protein [Brevibacillus sp. NRS-1366]
MLQINISLLRRRLVTPSLKRCTRLVRKHTIFRNSG